MEGDRKATWLFLNLLRAPWLAYPWAQIIHVILDDYFIHKTRLARDLLQQMGGKIRLQANVLVWLEVRFSSEEEYALAA